MTHTKAKVLKDIFRKRYDKGELTQREYEGHIKHINQQVMRPLLTLRGFVDG